MTLLPMLAVYAAKYPERLALRDQHTQLSYAELAEQVKACAIWLQGLGVDRIGFDAHNSVSWVIVDLACMQADVCMMPIPPFFSPLQVAHVVRKAGISHVITDHPERFVQRCESFASAESDQSFIQGYTLLKSSESEAAQPLPPDVVKVTFTSGTTGSPKGVLLTHQQISAVTESLIEVAQITSEDKHVCVMPLAVLLENIAGVYALLQAGAQVLIPSADALGMQGSGMDSPQRLLSMLNREGITTVILTPGMLESFIQLIEAGHPAITSLRFCALGGASVSISLLNRAAALQLPVYQGYGMSECASVVCLNTVSTNHIGSVGRALPHVRIKLADDGEVLIQGGGFTGYLGDPNESLSEWYATGDLGELSDDHALSILGRKRNVFITAYGRNVSPEWVEKEFTSHPEIQQIAVYGEARPFNSAVIQSSLSDEALANVIAKINKTLPDYARVTHWLRADEPFSPINQLLTATGRNRREPIYDVYADRLASFYNESIAL
jgi:long-chain acyl-CoA synthetase